MSLVQVELSASGCSLVQRIPTDCGVSECDGESPIMRRAWSDGGCCAMVKKLTHLLSPCSVVSVMLLGLLKFIHISNKCLITCQLTKDAVALH